MCIVSGPTTSISATKIFCLPSHDRTRQLTVYSNAVDSPADNLMILPVPCEASKIAFETVPKDLFSQCRDSFFSRFEGALGAYDSFGFDGSRDGKLAVQSHGSYEVVVVPSVADMDRIPESFTRVTPEAAAFIRSGYPSGFAFLFCRLRKGAVDYEPFAYSHAIAAGSAMFAPTKHFHLDALGSSGSLTVPSYSSLFDAAFASPLTPSGKHDMWDHVIYVAECAAPMSLISKQFRPHPKNKVDWAGFSSREFAYDPNLLMKMLEITGNDEPNLDIFLPLNDSGTKELDPADGVFGYLQGLMGF